MLSNQYIEKGFKFRARETCMSWFGPSDYYEVSDEKGNIEFIVQGPGGCMFECRRPSVFRVRVLQLRYIECKNQMDSLSRRA